MTYPQYGIGASNVFWPIGDVFPRYPSWSELNAPTGLTADPAAERLFSRDHLLTFGEDYHVTLTLVDIGEDILDDADDVPATGYVSTESRIWKEWGWSGKEYAWSATPVMDELDAWTGAVDVWIPATMHSQLGFNQKWRYSIKVVLNDGVDTYRQLSMLGSLAVRR